MKELRDYFQTASTVLPENRQVGWEIENLLVEKDTMKPIGLNSSQEVLLTLLKKYGWKSTKAKNGLLLRLEKGAYTLVYELGWNNLELITPTMPVSSIDWERMETEIKDIGLVAGGLGLALLSDTWDGSECDTLIFPDKRDKIWLDLDGDCLRLLGHIAAIHCNIDLVSIEEGMGMIKKLNRDFYGLEWSRSPAEKNKSVWERYIGGSLAAYSPTRYGPAPSSFPLYLDSLASFDVVMDRVDGDLVMINQPRSFKESLASDIDLFLRSVWWWSRLRKRGGKLVLEIRELNRSMAMREHFSNLRRVTGF